MDPKPSGFRNYDDKIKLHVYNLYRDEMIVDGVLMLQMMNLNKARSFQDGEEEIFLTFTRAIGDRIGAIKLCCAEEDLDDIDYIGMEVMMDDQMSENFKKEWEEKWKLPKPNPREMRLSPEFLTRFFRKKKHVAMKCCNVCLIS